MMSAPGLCSWQALGTSAVLALTDGRALADARTAVERELDLIDRSCSRFRADSELSRVNANAGEPVAVGALLIEALEVALRAARLTDGDVDPTLGKALEDAGYDRDWTLIAAASDPEQTPPPGEPAPAGRTLRLRARRRAAWQAIAIDHARGTITIPRGVKLDLGATAKAWAADRASRAAHEASGAGALVSLGGDVSLSGPPPGGGWQVHVTDDHRAGLDAPGQRIALNTGGLATSSVTVRRWRRHGVEAHHLIDPASGLPAEGPWRTASVAAADCTDANIASTAALIRGEGALEWLAELGLPARLVRHDGEALTLGSWPAPAPAPAAVAAAAGRAQRRAA